MTTDLTQAVRIDLRRDGGRWRIALRFPVATETGLRQDRHGRRIAPAFVQTVTVERAGAPVFSAHLGAHLARWPTIEFELEAAAPAETLSLTWTDQSGRRHTQPLPLAG